MKVRVRKSDRMFREYVLRFYDYTCARCGRTYSPEDCRGLHVSHYWSRRKENTRFSVDNVCLLCYGCHMLWGHGEEREKYKQFMIKRLGQEGYGRLAVCANIYRKRDDKMDEIVIKQMLKDIA